MIQDTFEKLQLNQLKLVTSFCQVKLEILTILVDARDPLATSPFSHCVTALEGHTRTFERQLQPKPDESRPERRLRLRGLQAVERTLERTLFDMLVELEWLIQWSHDEPLMQWERETFDRTVLGLTDIINGQIDMLNDPRVGSPVEPSYF